MTDDEIRDIREILQELVVNQREHSVEQRLLKEDVAQIKHVLIEGNGQPPITVRLALAESELERLQEERLDKKMPRATWVAILISTLVGVGGIIAAVS